MEADTFFKAWVLKSCVLASHFTSKKAGTTYAIYFKF